MNELFSEKNLRLTPEQIAAALKQQAQQAKLPALRKAKQEIEFYQFPKPVLIAILQSGYMPALAVAAAIHETWYKGFQRNPIRLASARLREFRISRGQKLRALKILEQTGLFDVKRFPRRNPLITLKWLRTTD